MTAAEVETEKPALREEHANAHDMKLTPSVIIRQIVSLGLCAFSVTIVGALIFTGNTRVAQETNPWIALIVCVSILCNGVVLCCHHHPILFVFTNIYHMTRHMSSLHQPTGPCRHLAFHDRGLPSIPRRSSTRRPCPIQGFPPNHIQNCRHDLQR